MGTLVLVRHGQAVMSAEGYGGLSDAGARQADALGAHLARVGRAPQAVYTGPRARHLETCERVGAALSRAGLSWPEPVVLDALDEYPAERVLAHAVATLDVSLETSGDGWGRMFMNVTRKWVSGELVVPDTEDWGAFRTRVAGGLDQMAQADDRRATVLAFTSGGPVAAATGHALGLDDLKTLELSWVHLNTGVTELAFREGSYGLRSFNARPHLPEDLITLR